MNKQKIIFIVGPTAVGKSEVALRLAQRWDGEIVSCDSMQIYREISIASGKPPQDYLARIPHHLINIKSVTEEFDVWQFNQMALKAVRDIQDRHKVPLVVGGSGMYMQILLDGIFEEPVSDPEFRRKLKARAQEEGLPHLYRELREVDPAAAAKIHGNDLKRVIRALEVFYLTGVPISQAQKKRAGLWGRQDIVLYVLNRERGELYERINGRVDDMFTQGLIEEIRQLQAVPLSRTAQAIIGVKEVREYLSGRIDLQTAREEMKQNTRRFAKRQLIWFRKDKRLKWMNIKTRDTAQDIVEGILKDVLLFRSGDAHEEID